MNIQLANNEDFTIITKSNQTIIFPDSSGTIALTSQITGADVTSVNGQTGAVITQLSSNYAPSTGINSELFLESGDTYETAFGKLEKIINDNEIITAAGLNDLNNEINDLGDNIYNDIGNVLNNLDFGVTSFNGNTGAITYTAPVTSVNGQTGAVSLTIPSEVTESTVAGWGFTKNTGTLTSETQLSKGTTSGNGNAVTDISVNGHQITLTKGATYTTLADVSTAVAAGVAGLVDSAPTTLDTLNELAAALGDDPNFATTVAGQIGAKYTKPSGGIPSTDLDSSVQASLSKADTALQSAPVTSVNGQTGAVSLTIPSEVTESTVSGWGFTKNAGTLTSHAEHKLTASNGTATSTSGTITFIESLTGTNTATSGDLTLTATRKSVTIPAEVTESTVSGWGFTKNTGTLTSETQLSKGTATGSGNAVTDINVSNHQITLVKGKTFLETAPVTSVNGQTGAVTISALPTVTSSDNGKILMVVNGAWALVSPSTLYSGSGAPNNAQGNNGDIYLQT